MAKAENVSVTVNHNDSEGKLNKPPGHIKCKAISSEELHVSWESPPTESIHGILQGFKVTYVPSRQFLNEVKR